MKRGLSVILACCLVSACGGGGEPFLAVSATYDEADTEAHAMELTNLYPPPCISLTEILLAAGFAVSVIANLASAWKLWTRKKQEVKNEMPKIESDNVTEGSEATKATPPEDKKEAYCLSKEAIEALTVLDESHPEESTTLRRELAKWQTKVEDFSQSLADKNDEIQNLINWADTFQGCMVHLVVGNVVKNRTLLAQLTDKNITDLLKGFPPNINYLF